MHEWGDNDYDWKGLNEAMTFIRSYVRRHSLCTLSMKEKYGTIRYERMMPPYVWRSVPFFVANFWFNCSLYNKWAEYGWSTLVDAIWEAQKKWPHLKDEIMEDLASYEELVGKDIHDRYWKTL